jgi:hypothetical protein
VNFIFVIEKSSDIFFYKVQISTNYKKIMLKFAVFSIALSRPATILPVVGEITRIKTFNFRIKLGNVQWSVAYNTCIFL